MTLRYSGVSLDNDNTDDSFELLEQSKTGQTSTLASFNNDWTNQSSRLPARILPLRSTTHAVRSAFWMGLLTFVTVVGFSVLASDIWCFLLGAKRSDLLSKSASCDLQVRSGSSVQGAFTINMRGATHLTFTQAKAIDVIWQLFVGAGGRVVMAWIAYKVFMDGLARQLEGTPMSYQLYASMIFDTNSLFSVWYVLKAVYHTKGCRSKIFLIWFYLSTVYMLGFPTLTSAMAGYLTPSLTGFKMKDNTFVTTNNSLLTSCYNVSGGSSYRSTKRDYSPRPSRPRI
ncbi:hypothetical protein ABVK25_005455 [Lepraria finkii]|uniref:Uncharacterized protein n=1 Tax=Lepraria finkii TaxID=1340010 RepID=A0ABR4B8X9_9LECA